MGLKRWAVPVALVGVLMLGGCAGERVDAGATTTPSASTTPSTTAKPSATATPKPAASASPAPTTPPVSAAPETSTGAPDVPVVLPVDSITDACTAWQTSLGQDAATFPLTQAGAAQLAAGAAAIDGQWEPLATDMATLVSIGSDTSASAVAQGQALFTDLSTRCGAVGVTVSAG